MLSQKVFGVNLSSGTNKQTFICHWIVCGSLDPAIAATGKYFLNRSKNLKQVYNIHAERQEMPKSHIFALFHFHLSLWLVRMSRYSLKKRYEKVVNFLQNNLSKKNARIVAAFPGNISNCTFLTVTHTNLILFQRKWNIVHHKGQLWRYVT